MAIAPAIRKFARFLPDSTPSVKDRRVGIFQSVVVGFPDKPIR
jgi:hypothetical protein